MLHYRPRGSKQKPLKARWEEGRGNAYMGYLPSWLLVRAAYRGARREAADPRRLRAARRLRLGAPAAAAADRRPGGAPSCAPSSARGSRALPRAHEPAIDAVERCRPAYWATGRASRDRPAQPPAARHRRRRARPRARARPGARGGRPGHARAGRDSAPARGLPGRAARRARVPLRRDPSGDREAGIELEVVQGGEAGVMWAVNAERRGAARGQLWRRAGPTCSSRRLRAAERHIRAAAVHAARPRVPAAARAPREQPDLPARSRAAARAGRQRRAAPGDGALADPLRPRRGPRAAGRGARARGASPTCSRRTRTRGTSSAARARRRAPRPPPTLVGEERARWLVAGRPGGDPRRRAAAGAAAAERSSARGAAYFRALRRG